MMIRRRLSYKDFRKNAKMTAGIVFRFFFFFFYPSANVQQGKYILFMTKLHPTKDE